MECSAEGCEFESRYSTTGLCLVCQGLYSSGITPPSPGGYNVPGNRLYNSDAPTDYLVRSSLDPVGVAVDGGAWGLSYDGSYGVARDANSTLYLTNDQSKVQYQLHYDGNRLPYILDGGEKHVVLFKKVGTDTVPSIVYAMDGFPGKDGSALSDQWAISDNGQGGTVTIQNGKAVLKNVDTPYALGTAAYLVGPPLANDFEFTCDYSLESLETQYPTIGLRARSTEVWSGGGGGGLPKTGYFFILSPGASTIQLQQGYQAGTVLDSIPFTFPSKDMKLRAGVSGKNIRLKLWATGTDEPSGWTYDKPLATSEASGSVLFTALNGPEPVSRTVTIDNFVMTSRAYPTLDTVAAPAGNIPGWDQTFVENFNTPAEAGRVKTVYANSWQPYRDEGIYFPDRQISVHDGMMDVFMDGYHGAAGSFGRANDYANHVSGKFSMRMRVLGARYNGTAVMVWPSTDVWNDGEIDYPEANFEDTPMVHHHVMGRGDNSANYEYTTGASWRDWHVYSVEWIAGQSVKYYLDDELVFTVTQDVPTAPHRYMFQVGNYGESGHMYIDWVSIYSYNSSTYPK